MQFRLTSKNIYAWPLLLSEMKKIFLTPIIFSLLLSCNQSKVKLSAENYIKSYNQINGDCKEALLRILRKAGIEDGNYKVKELFNLDVRLNKQIYGQSQFIEGKFFLAVVENDSIEITDNIRYQYLNIMPNYGKLSACEVVDYDSVLLVHTGWEFVTNMQELFKNACFNLNPKESSTNYTKKTSGYWLMDGSTEILGTWQKDTNRPFHLVGKLYDSQWYFEKEVVYFLYTNNDTIGQSRYNIKSGELIFIDLSDTLRLHTFTNEGMVVSDYSTDNVNYIYKIRE